MISFLNRLACNLTRSFVLSASIVLAASFLTAYSSRAQAIPVDTAGTAMSGLWNIDAESGWGASVVHQFGTMFITIYTFDANRNPIWYAATNCVVANDRCRDPGMLRIANGEAVTAPWSGNRSIVAAGSLEMIFNTIDSATMNFVIDGRSGTKNVTRSKFANPPATPPAAGAFPFDFNGVRLVSITFTTENIGSTATCKVQLTATNISNTPVTPFLQFDIVVNNIVAGDVTFTGNSVRPGLGFQSTMTVLSNGAFIGCNQFKLDFNAAGSRVFMN